MILSLTLKLNNNFFIEVTKKNILIFDLLLKEMVRTFIKKTLECVFSSFTLKFSFVFLTCHWFISRNAPWVIKSLNLKHLVQAVGPYLFLDLASSSQVWYVDSRTTLKPWLIDWFIDWLTESRYIKKTRNIQCF